jgi:hypothetical protein
MKLLSEIKFPSKETIEHLSVEECVALFKNIGLHIPPGNFYKKFFVRDNQIKSEHLFIIGDRFCLDYQIRTSFYIHHAMTEEEILAEPHFGAHITFHNPYGPAAMYPDQERFYIDGNVFEEEDMIKKRTLLRIGKL